MGEDERRRRRRRRGWEGGGEGQTNIREADHMRRPIVGEGPLQ